MTAAEAVQHATELVKGPVKVINGRTILQVEDIEDRKLGKRVQWLENRLYSHMGHLAKSALAVGKILSEVNDLLTPHGLFTYWLNRVPQISPATANRWMAGYRAISQRIPAPVVQIAMASGMPLFGSGDKPFGRYTEAVKMLPPPPNDLQRAEQWIADVKSKAKELKASTGTSVVASEDACAVYLLRAHTRARKSSATTPDIERWLQAITVKAIKLAAESGTKKPPVSTVTVKRKGGRPRKAVHAGPSNTVN